MPLGFGIEEVIEILVSEVKIEAEILLLNDFDGKVKEKWVPLAGGQPEQVALLFRVSGSQKGQLILSKRFKPRNYLGA